MLTERTERLSPQRWIGIKVPGVIMGVLFSVWIGGLAHAQVCNPTEASKLLASDGAFHNSFGRSVSLDGDTAVVGAPLAEDNGYRSGSAYVFLRDGGVWTEQSKLLPADGAADDQFGTSVSISGDTAFVGAWADGDNGNLSGSVYVFTRTEGVWTQHSKLLPVDGEAGDYFGWSVSIDGDTALVGAERDGDNGTQAGSVYVYTRTGGVWTQQSKLLAADGLAWDHFGNSVSINGDTAAIGAHKADDNGPISGSAYVFTRTGSVWTQQSKLLPDDGAEWDFFGQSVSVSGDTVVIGAFWDDDNGSNSGSAYTFARIGSVWTQQAKLLPADGGGEDRFGYCVSVSGGTVVIGAYYDDHSGWDAGSAYVFTDSEGMWTQQAKLLASDGAQKDTFGISVSVSGDTAVIGAHGDDGGTSWTSSAYVFDLGCAGCAAELTGDGVLDFFDVQMFLGWFASGDLQADFIADGVLDFFDIQEYLNLYAAGCP